MLEKVDLTKEISKEEYKEKMPVLEAKIGRLQRECKALNIPIMIENASLHVAVLDKDAGQGKDRDL